MRSKGRKYRRRDWILVIILAVLKLDLKVEAHTNWRERMKEENAREGRRGSRSRAREVRNNSHLLSRRKEGGEGISGDARRKRLTALWIHNFYLRLVGNDCDAKIQPEGGGCESKKSA